MVSTGRIDFANQVNNALVFPGIFRGALANRVQKITDEHKIAAAEALSSAVVSPTADKIIPRIDEPGLVALIADKIR